MGCPEIGLSGKEFSALASLHEFIAIHTSQSMKALAKFSMRAAGDFWNESGNDAVGANAYAAVSISRHDMYIAGRDI